jgi:hypothetical protein
MPQNDALNYQLFLRTGAPLSHITFSGKHRPNAVAFITAPSEGKAEYITRGKLKNKKSNTLNAELNPICHFQALLGAHRILYVSRIRVTIEVEVFRGTGSTVSQIVHSYRPVSIV